MSDMEKAVCNICNVKDCAYKSRNMEDGCEYVSWYERGWDDAIEKVCVFLQDRIAHDSIDYPMATKHLIDDLKKELEGE